MIPRTIHYCWFGRNPKPKSVERCVASWKRQCPDYQIIEWNEDNFDVESACDFVRQAYKNKKWAFVSDYARLQVVYDHGGIYLDTDVELLKSLDVLISAGKGFMGFEKPDAIASGLGFAAEKGDSIIKEMMDYYSSLSFDTANPAQVKCPIINTLVLKRHGLELNNQLQLIDNLQILSELKILTDASKEKDNVVLLDIICFEYILLEFKELIDWVFTPDDEFLEKRADIISARTKLVSAISNGDSSYKEIKEIKDYCDNIENYNM